MPEYDSKKVEDLRWSLSHYYSPHHFILYHEGDIQTNRPLHLTSTTRGVLLHLGCATFDLENAVKNYHNDVKITDSLKIKI